MKTKQNNEEWKETELGDTFEIKRGKTITKNLVVAGCVPVIAGGQQPAYYHNESNRKGETITISGSGAYAGFVNYFNQPIFASDCSTLQVKNPNENLTSYGYYYLKYKQKVIYRLQKGIAQPHVYPKDLMKIKIPLPFRNGKPDLEKQKQIVSILEKVEKLKEKRIRGNALLDEYLKSVFNEMFGKISLQNFDKETIEIIDGDRGTNYPNGNDFSEQGYCLFLNTGNVRKNGFNFKKLMFITKEKDELLRKGKVRRNDIILTTRGTIGNVALYDETISYKQIRINSGMVLLRANLKKIIPKFLEYLIQTSTIQTQFLRMNSGTAQPQLPITNLKKIKIPLPPLTLQEKFASIVKEVEKLKEKQNKSKKDINELFDALMQKAFAGELI